MNYNQGGLAQNFNPTGSYPGRGAEIDYNQNAGVSNYPRINNQRFRENSGLIPPGSGRYDGSLNTRPWENYGQVNNQRPSFNPASVEYDRGNNGIPDYLNNYRSPARERGNGRFSNKDEDDDDDDDFRRPGEAYGRGFSSIGRRPDFGGHSMNSNRRNEVEPGVRYDSDDDNQRPRHSSRLSFNNQRNRLGNSRPVIEYDRSSGRSDGLRSRFSGN